MRGGCAGGCKHKSTKDDEEGTQLLPDQSQMILTLSKLDSNSFQVCVDDLRPLKRKAHNLLIAGSSKRCKQHRLAAHRH